MTVRSLLNYSASGCSGAWVVRDGSLCGYIFAVYEDEPYAHIITSEKLISDIASVTGVSSNDIHLQFESQDSMENSEPMSTTAPGYEYCESVGDLSSDCSLEIQSSYRAPGCSCGTICKCHGLSGWEEPTVEAPQSQSRSGYGEPPTKRIATEEAMGSSKRPDNNTTSEKSQYEGLLLAQSSSSRTTAPTFPAPFACPFYKRNPTIHRQSSSCVRGYHLMHRLKYAFTPFLVEFC